MITHIIWDLGDTINTPPTEGRDLKPLDECTEIQLRPNVWDTLKELSDLGYQHAVLSNTATSDSHAASRMLERLGVKTFFSFVYATQSELDQDKPQKPNPIVFEKVLKALQIKPEQAVMVGNSWDNDVLGANRSGIHAIWLQNPAVSTRTDPSTLIQLPPWIIPAWDIKDIPSAVQTLKDAIKHSTVI